MAELLRTHLVTDHRQIVPKHSASLDRYRCTGIHANHTDMTKFSNQQDPDYRNVLSELRRLTQLCQEARSQQPAATATSSAVQGVNDDSIGNESSSTMERDRGTLPEQRASNGPSRSAIKFSGTFNTSGGKMYSGNNFNSGGGSMSF